jgi:hypothetical protein
MTSDFERHQNGEEEELYVSVCHKPNKAEEKAR